MGLSQKVSLRRSYRRYLLAVFVLLFLAAPVHAQYGDEEAKQVDVCAKYMTQSGWSDSYSVEATVVSGSVLNDKTGSLNYDALSTYAVIFWSDDQATVLKLRSLAGEITSFGTKATDQRGRTWHVSTSDMCF